MAHEQSPAHAVVVPTNTAAAFPASTLTNVLATSAATSAVANTGIILEGMVCLVTAAGGDVTLSDSAVTAARTLVITTVNPVAGTTIRFGAQGIFMGQGLKIVTAAAAGSWLVIYRPA